MGAPASLKLTQFLKSRAKCPSCGADVVPLRGGSIAPTFQGSALCDVVKTREVLSGTQELHLEIHRCKTRRLAQTGRGPLSAAMSAEKGGERG